MKLSKRITSINWTGCCSLPIGWKWTCKHKSFPIKSPINFTKCLFKFDKKNHNSNNNSSSNDKIEIDSHSIGNRRFIQCIQNVNVDDSEYWANQMNFHYNNIPTGNDIDEPIEQIVGVEKKERNFYFLFRNTETVKTTARKHTHY